MSTVKKTDATVPPVAEVADLRASVAALTAAIAAQGEQSASNIAALAAALLAPRARAPRAVAATQSVSETERAVAEGGFRRGYRAKMFRDLLAKGPGAYPLATISPVTEGYSAKSAEPVADAIARRLNRRPRVGYTLVVDKDEADATKTELVFALRTSADAIDTSPETESDKSE